MIPKDPDEAHDFYMNLLKEVQKHTVPSPETKRMFEELKQTMEEGFKRITDRQDQANHATAKHSEWIARYDIRVAEDVPNLRDQVKSNTNKIYMATGAFTIINIVIGFLK